MSFIIFFRVDNCEMSGLWGFAVLSILGILALTTTVAWVRITKNRFEPQTVPSSRHRGHKEPFLPPRVERYFSSILSSQRTMDVENRAFTPNLNKYSINIPGHKLLISNSYVYNGHETVIFPVFGNDNILVKFQADCHEVKSPDTVHPLIKDFFYGQRASELGIAPRPIFLSPPVRFARSLITNQFTMRGIDVDECILRGGTVRFLVVERKSGYRDLHALTRKFLDGMVPFQDAMKIGYNLVHVLRKLHLEGFTIHGDLHPGNILVEDKTLNVQLIDFGRSGINTRKLSELPVREDCKWCHPSLTHWQMEGFDWSMRDDVFNAMRVIALIMNHEGYKTFETTLRADRGSLIRWKRGGFIFSVDSCDPIEELGMSASSQQAIRLSFRKILDSVRTLEINAVPPYGFIADELRFCRATAALLDGAAPQTTA